VKLRTLFLALGASSALAVGVAACGSSNDNGSTAGGSGGGTINGAGATFPAPVYAEWGNRVKSQGLTVNYQAVGSGQGVAELTANTVDFGASDASMTDQELAATKKNGDVVHVPTVLGAVTVSYNLPGTPSGLKLDGATVAGIFLGKITKWNDAAIAGLNPGVSLPSTDITVVHRSDESGTTKLFTTFLADYSPEWKSKVGADKTVKWPTGTGAKGNDGVAGGVKQTEGAVGYVEEAFALQNHFTTADVKNAAGKFVAPTLDSTSAAGDGVKAPADLRFSAINAPGAASYPIASATFLLVYQDMCKAGKSKGTATNVVRWLNYALGDGQTVAPDLQYAPLPDKIRQQAQAKVDGLQCNGAPLK
jgi:phosphate transport system substrate-binding protein